MIKKYHFFIFILLSSIFLSACFNDVEEEIEKVGERFPVSGDELAEFKDFQQEISYSGTVSPIAQANVIAQVSGTLIESQVELGDKVEVGQRLARIDDLTGSRQTSMFNSNQIRQAEIAVSQAKNTYDQAVESYNSLLSSSKKELEQAEISYQQALNNQDNLEVSNEENLLSAQISLETAQLSVRQAKNNLDNQTKQLDQAKNDLKENSRLSADSSYSTVSNLLTSINNITGFDRNNIVSIAYENNLGALDSSSLIRARNLYRQTKDEFEKIDKEEDDLEDYVKSILDLSDLAKKLTDNIKVLFDKTITSSNLSQIQLSEIQNIVASLQGQANSNLSQIKQTNQALNNFQLEYESNIESLQEAYELAIKQEESAKQNLRNLQAGNISQEDQASFSVKLAKNQLDNLEIRLASQIDSARSQMESAKIQYDNALLNLESMYDAYTLISPLEGTVTQKNFSNGDTINAGENIYTIAQKDKLKVVFFVEEDKTNYLKLGQDIVIDNDFIASISSISPQADQFSKKFKIEALLPKDSNLALGSVVDINISLSRQVENDNTYYLPLSSININQLGNFVFIYQDSKAKEIEVDILSIIGERAEVKIQEKTDDDIIITDGNRRLQDGQLIKLDN